jgi:hypothetical protein
MASSRKAERAIEVCFISGKVFNPLPFLFHITTSNLNKI